MKRVMFLIGVFVTVGLALSGLAQNKKPPSQEAIAFAKESADF
jgi:hypothetical protein